MLDKKGISIDYSGKKYLTKLELNRPHKMWRIQKFS